MGQVTKMTFTTKCVVDGQSVVALLVSTSKQQPKELPLGLQVENLCYKELQTQDKQNLPSSKENMAAKPLARKCDSLHVCAPSLSDECMILMTALVLSVQERYVRHTRNS